MRTSAAQTADSPRVPPPTEKKKKIVRDYLIGCNFYSYNAADVEEDPVKRWIGREVKRFLSEAHVHLPFLLQVAAAPPEVCDAVADAMTGVLAMCLTEWLACS